MRVLVTGINGQLGYDVYKELNKRGHQAIGVNKDQMDLTVLSEIKRCIENRKPDAIIHCAAYTAVDSAEDNEELCRKVNALAVQCIANCAKNLDIPMIYISTDYVFDGSKDGIYNEDDIPNPINIYGKTKYEGEVYIREILNKYYIVRISWVFGENGNNFIDTMIRLSKNKDSLNIINDQIGSPTYTKDLAPLLVDMIETDKYGTYHATNEGFCSWYDFAKEIFDIANIYMNIKAIKTSEYPTKATRPLNSKMSKQKLIDNGFGQLRYWRDAVKDYLENV
ncbi:dTDP-4-dehydrorhamnose reductase [Paraclostridium sordellii]|uniref:dTDP-4-dehydrorhamnose reductase n=1 Tax=Paraclostridium sordellii TaxID=1505 RepID=A0A9P1L0K0_PARSO|nr:dTDP-4-dehydrorhamnose reductase [Paeniclostridium sordellii]CEO33569.1 dTDP-4-dehydrorhamnose reductase [[Clostridium] sordellii] [Paeniclostridium sordellii]